jgi:hypothetical protein
LFLNFRSSVNLKIYLPETMYVNLKENALEYIFNYTNFNNKTSSMSIPELVNWFDKNFVNNIQVYKE